MALVAKRCHYQLQLPPPPNSSFHLDLLDLMEIFSHSVEVPHSQEGCLREFNQLQFFGSLAWKTESKSSSRVFLCVSYCVEMWQLEVEPWSRGSCL